MSSVSYAQAAVFSAQLAAARLKYRSGHCSTDYFHRPPARHWQCAQKQDFAPMARSRAECADTIRQSSLPLLNWLTNLFPSDTRPSLPIAKNLPDQLLPLASASEPYGEELRAFQIPLS